MVLIMSTFYQRQEDSEEMQNSFVGNLYLHGGIKILLYKRRNL